jgi:predicted NodU family carbamoyl transferase
MRSGVSYDEMAAAAIRAAATLPLDAGQRHRYELAKKVAAETGGVAVSVLPIINGCHTARRGEPPVTPITPASCDDGYAVGYLAAAQEAGR